MTSIVLKVGYIGTGYNGFQRQPNQPHAHTIQGALEQALLEATGKRTPLASAGRTDKGVHAIGQMVQFETESTIPVHRYVPILNRLLPEEIRVYESWKAKEGFHVRHDALRKTYVYRLDLNPVPGLLRSPYVLHFPHKRDLVLMDHALGTLLGTHDFKAFASRFSTVENTIRTIHEVGIHVTEDGLMTIRITGSGFLQHMVRIIVGTLLDVGKGRFDTSVFEKAIASGQRSDLGKTASPKGLMLESIQYKEGVLG